jgi:hypothetical protein
MEQDKFVEGKIGRTPLKISWDKLQWIIDFGKEPTYYVTTLESLYYWMVDATVKATPKSLVNSEDLAKAIKDATDNFNVLLKELSKKLDIARAAIEAVEEVPKKQQTKKKNGSFSKGGRKAKAN